MSHAFAHCSKCSLQTQVPFESISRWLKKPEEVSAKDGKVFYRGKEVTEWKASPNPYAPNTPRMMLKFKGGDRTNITGSLAGEVWAAIKGSEYPYGKGLAASPRASKNFMVQGDTVVSKRLDPEFEKLKKFKPGTVLTLRKNLGAYNLASEAQDFMVQKLYEEDCSILMSPVKGNKVADVTAIFTAAEIEKYTVTVASEDGGWDLLPQQDQVMPKGPVVHVQSYYDLWE